MAIKKLRNDETIISSISVTDIFFDVYLGKWNYRAIPKVKTWSYFLTIPKSSSSREPSEKCPGDQKGHQGFTLSMCEHPDEIIINRFCNCKCCGQSIQETEVIDYEKRQKFDISINHKVTEYLSEIKKCLTVTVKTKLISRNR